MTFVNDNMTVEDLIEMTIQSNDATVIEMEKRVRELRKILDQDASCDDVKARIRHLNEEISALDYITNELTYKGHHETLSATTRFALIDAAVCEHAYTGLTINLPFSPVPSEEGYIQQLCSGNNLNATFDGSAITFSTQEI